jgi:hypothetical protein
MNTNFHEWKKKETVDHPDVAQPQPLKPRVTLMTRMGEKNMWDAQKQTRSGDFQSLTYGSGRFPIAPPCSGCTCHGE